MSLLEMVKSLRDLNTDVLFSPYLYEMQMLNNWQLKLTNTIILSIQGFNDKLGSINEIYFNTF